MRFGDHSVFKTEGIKLAIQFFKNQRVIGFLPEYLLDQEKISQASSAAKTPDDPEYLRELVK